MCYDSTLLYSVTQSKQTYLCTQGKQVEKTNENFSINETKNTHNSWTELKITKPLVT